MQKKTDTERNFELPPLLRYPCAVDLILKGVFTRLDESFIVVHTKKVYVALCIPTEDENQTVKTLRWFSLEDIKQSPDVIFPLVLADYLPDVLVGKYPKNPIAITPKSE